MLTSAASMGCSGSKQRVSVPAQSRAPVFPPDAGQAHRRRAPVFLPDTLHPPPPLCADAAAASPLPSPPSPERPVVRTRGYSADAHHVITLPAAQHSPTNSAPEEPLDERELLDPAALRSDVEEAHRVVPVEQATEALLSATARTVRKASARRHLAELFIAAAALLVLLGLWFWFDRVPTGSQPAPWAPSAPPSPSAPAPPSFYPPPPSPISPPHSPLAPPSTMHLVERHRSVEASGSTGRQLMALAGSVLSLALVCSCLHFWHSQRQKQHAVELLAELKAALTVASFAETLEQARERAYPTGVERAKVGHGPAARQPARPGLVAKARIVRPPGLSARAWDGVCGERGAGREKGSCTSHEMPYPLHPTLPGERCRLPNPSGLPAPTDAAVGRSDHSVHSGERRCERPLAAATSAELPPLRSASGISRQASRKFISRSAESPRSSHTRAAGGAGALETARSSSSHSSSQHAPGETQRGRAI